MLEMSSAEPAESRLLKHSELNSKQRVKLSKWVNTPGGEQQLTALHFASNNGNMELIRLLIDELGAD